MINVFVKGRLGNQMFQYAAARGMQQRFYPDEQINMNFKYVVKDGKKKNEEGWVNQLLGFKLNESLLFDKKVKLCIDQLFLLGLYFVSFKIIKLFSRKDNYYQKKKKLEERIQKFYNKRGLYLYSYGYYDFAYSKRKNKLMIGYFESSKYFNNVKDELKEEFMPKKDKKKENEKIYQRAASGESVCISVRRGDFYSSGNIDDCAVCDQDYFEEATSRMKEKINNLNLVVFSDDVDWVKKNVDFKGISAIFETGNDDVYEKMRMMSLCSNFIISNSSFSWWAQYLSANHDKIVIAPRKWRNNNVFIYRDIYEEGWILV